LERHDFDYANYANDDVDKEARTSVPQCIVTAPPSITSIRWNSIFQIYLLC